MKLYVKIWSDPNYQTYNIKLKDNQINFDNFIRVVKKKSRKDIEGRKIFYFDRLIVDEHSFQLADICSEQVIYIF